MNNEIINEYFFTLGKTPIPFTIVDTEDVNITINGHSFTASCVAKQLTNNQDGTYNLNFKLKRNN